MAWQPTGTGRCLEQERQNWKRVSLGSRAMSQREVVWILMGAVLIAAAGVGAFVVMTYDALSLFR